MLCFFIVSDVEVIYEENEDTRKIVSYSYNDECEYAEVIEPEESEDEKEIKETAEIIEKYIFRPHWM